MTAVIVPDAHHWFLEDTNPVDEEEDPPMNDNDDEVTPPPTTRLDDCEYVAPSLAHEDAMIDAAMDEALEDASESETMAVDEDETDIRYGGLSNLGNSCYMASALQMLASLDTFMDELESVESSEGSELRTELLALVRRLRKGETVTPSDFKRVVDERSSLFVGYRQQDAHEFLITLLDLIDEDYKRKDDQEMASPAPDGEEKAAANSEAMDDDGVAAAGLRQSLSELDFNQIEMLVHGASSSRETLPVSSPVVAHHCRLVGGRMNTSGVVLTPRDELGASGREVDEPQAQSQPMACDEDQSVTDEVKIPSPVDACFTTATRVRLTCDSCMYTRTHEETFLHLSLEIGADSTSSVDEGLRRFFAPEKREIKCEKCFCATATQTSEITRLPRVLLLHFKRFLVDVSPDYSSVTYRKNTSNVSFEESMSLQPSRGFLADYLATDCELPEDSDTYEARGVVNHIGSSASCGHYTADGLRPYSTDTREWTRFNDSIVSRIAPIDAVHRSFHSAYIVAYELR